MKKIIWIFGESATGKLTLINNLYNSDINTINTFNMNNKKISISEITLEDRNHDKYDNVVDMDYYDDSLIEEDGLYFNKENALLRRKGIMYDIENFLNNDSDVLLIKGQVNDMNTKRGNIVGIFLDQYANRNDLEIEVFILQVTDKDILKNRIESKPWFKEFTHQEEKDRLLSEIPIKQEKHKNDVISCFSSHSIPISIIESLNNSYRIEGVINGKSSNIRR
ncbi:MAG: hypothetical protein E7158_03880 [Firmicutes bacterium]|nr:hypothetical protein [Bacillota bacterium]